LKKFVTILESSAVCLCTFRVDLRKLLSAMVSADLSGRLIALLTIDEVHGVGVRKPLTVMGMRHCNRQPFGRTRGFSGTPGTFMRDLAVDRGKTPSYTLDPRSVAAISRT
jgi:hypothetical protein